MSIMNCFWKQQLGHHTPSKSYICIHLQDRHRTNKKPPTAIGELRFFLQPSNPWLTWSACSSTVVILSPTQTTHYCKANPSKLPYMCIVWSQKKTSKLYNDPCWIKVEWSIYISPQPWHWLSRSAKRFSKCSLGWGIRAKASFSSCCFSWLSFQPQILTKGIVWIGNTSGKPGSLIHAWSSTRWYSNPEEIEWLLFYSSNISDIKSWKNFCL